MKLQKPDRSSLLKRHVRFDRNPPRETTTTWLTPKPMLDSLGPIDLDPCVPHQMPWPTAKRMLTIQEDGLAKPWPRQAFVFHNPPFGAGQEKWMAKAAKHGNGITLVLARFDTRWMHTYVLNHPTTSAIVFVKGRVPFCRPDGTSGPGCPVPAVFIAYGDKAAKRLRRAVRSGAIPGVFFTIARAREGAGGGIRASNDDCYHYTPLTA